MGLWADITGLSKGSIQLEARRYADDIMALHDRLEANLRATGCTHHYVKTILLGHETEIVCGICEMKKLGIKPPEYKYEPLVCKICGTALKSPHMQPTFDLAGGAICVNYMYCPNRECGKEITVPTSAELIEKHASPAEYRMLKSINEDCDCNIGEGEL